MWVVSTLRDWVLNRALLQGPQQRGCRGKVAVPASTLHEVDGFRREGVDLVLVPYADTVKEAAEKLLGEARQYTDSDNAGVRV